jgi:hypothetical protein
MEADERLNHRWPELTTEVGAGGTQCHGDPASSLEPLGDVSDQRREGGRGAEADQQPVDDGELQKGLGEGGQDVARGERQGAA